MSGSFWDNGDSMMIPFDDLVVNCFCLFIYFRGNKVLGLVMNKIFDKQVGKIEIEIE
jgi:hypothetical protein